MVFCNNNEIGWVIERSMLTTCCWEHDNSNLHTSSVESFQHHFWGIPRQVIQAFKYYNRFHYYYKKPCFIGYTGSIGYAETDENYINEISFPNLYLSTWSIYLNNIQLYNFTECYVCDWSANFYTYLNSIIILSHYFFPTL